MPSILSVGLLVLGYLIIRVGNNWFYERDQLVTKGAHPHMAIMYFPGQYICIYSPHHSNTLLGFLNLDEE